MEIDLTPIDFSGVIRRHTGRLGTKENLDKLSKDVNRTILSYIRNVTKVECHLNPDHSDMKRTVIKITIQGLTKTIII